MANESILISDVIAAAPDRIFGAWLDSAEHSAFTGSPASIAPGLGGAHSAFDGYIQGRTLELDDGSRIVQSWRTSEFPADSPDSRLEITLEPTLGGTLVTLLHTEIPPGQSDRYRSGWNEFYLSRMKIYFSEAREEAVAQAPTPRGSAETQPVKRAAPERPKAPAKAHKTGKVATGGKLGKANKGGKAEKAAKVRKAGDAHKAGKARTAGKANKTSNVRKAPKTAKRSSKTSARKGKRSSKVRAAIGKKSVKTRGPRTKRRK